MHMSVRSAAGYLLYDIMSIYYRVSSVVCALSISVYSAEDIEVI